MNKHKELYPENNFNTLAILINYRKPYNEVFLNAVYSTTYLHKLDWRIQIVPCSNIDHLNEFI